MDDSNAGTEPKAPEPTPEEADVTTTQPEDSVDQPAASSTEFKLPTVEPPSESGASMPVAPEPDDPAPEESETTPSDAVADDSTTGDTATEASPSDSSADTTTAKESSPNSPAPDKSIVSTPSKAPKKPKSGVGVAIIATIIIVLGLAALAVYAYLKTK